MDQCGKVEASREFAFPADQVWGVLGDFGNHTWIPSVRHVEVLGNGVGSIRRLTTDTGIVDERLDARDEPTRTFAYSVVSAMPYPVEDYRVRVQIEEITPASSRVHWRAAFRSKVLDVAQAQQTMAAVYVSIGEWLNQELTRRFSAQA
jgi:hypothetical protein